MTCWWNRTRAKLKLQVPAAALGRTEFVVSAMVSRGDGVHALLHEPLTATDTNVYRLDLAPNGVDLDLVQPQLALRLPRNGSLPERTFAYGAWSGWLRTFRATKVTEWHLRPLPSNATNVTNATEALPNRTNASKHARTITARPRCGEAAPTRRSRRRRLPYRRHRRRRRRLRSCPRRRRRRMRRRVASHAATWQRPPRTSST